MGATFDTYSNVPISPGVGHAHYCTDCPIIRYYIGGAWQNHLTGFGPIDDPVPTTGWTNLLANSPTLTPIGPGLHFGTTETASNQRQDTYRTPPATPYTIRMVCSAVNQGTRASTGVFFADTSGSKLQFLLARASSLLGWRTRNESPIGTLSSQTDRTSGAGNTSPFLVIELVNDGTNLTYRVGDRFDNIGQVHTETIASFLGAVNAVGVHINATNADPLRRGNTGFTIWDWKVT
jgi:hypothetical protein